MLSDDTFRNELADVITALRAWKARNDDCAMIEEAETGDFWRLMVAPRMERACPLELILHRAQRYDALIGEETYEGLPVERLDIFAPLVEAVADGRVVTRTWATPATGALHSVETIVQLERGTLTGERMIDPVASLVGREACVARDRHWVPYRR